MKTKHPGGRPPKFTEPRRPITVTLPERTLRQLESISDDRARAIVKAVDHLFAGETSSEEQVDLQEVAPGRAVIRVRPSKALRRIPFLKLIEVAPARFLLTLPAGSAMESLEVAIMDLIEHVDVETQSELPMLQTLKKLIGQQRRRQKAFKAEIIVVDTNP